MIPGSNLLNMALTLIAPQTVDYYQYLSRTTNSIGVYESVFASPVTIIGSFQPIPRQLYEQYGLEFQKEYWILYTSTPLADIARDISGDQIVFNNRRYECQSTTEWFALDGWVGTLCVFIGTAS